MDRVQWRIQSGGGGGGKEGMGAEERVRSDFSLTRNSIYFGNLG